MFTPVKTDHEQLKQNMLMDKEMLTFMSFVERTHSSLFNTQMTISSLASAQWNDRRSEYRWDECRHQAWIRLERKQRRSRRVLDQ